LAFFRKTSPETSEITASTEAFCCDKIEIGNKMRKAIMEKILSVSFIMFDFLDKLFTYSN
jgi:hypothetical protein